MNKRHGQKIAKRILAPGLDQLTFAYRFVSSISSELRAVALASACSDLIMRVIFSDSSRPRSSRTDASSDCTAGRERRGKEEHRSCTFVAAYLKPHEGHASLLQWFRLPTYTHPQLMVSPLVPRKERVFEFLPGRSKLSYLAVGCCKVGRRLVGLIPGKARSAGLSHEVSVFIAGKLQGNTHVCTATTAGKKPYLYVRASLSFFCRSLAAVASNDSNCTVKERKQQRLGYSKKGALR